MFEQKTYSDNRDIQYNTVIKQLEALIKDEPDVTANLANASALLNQFLDDINWVGFYLWKDTELVLGPFQGLPACIRIPSGKGVCGTAYANKQTMLVPDVNQFPGHIVCDANSQSEIVIPLIINNKVYGVLDIDSPNLNRFDEVDKKNLEKFVRVIEQNMLETVIS